MLKNLATGLAHCAIFVNNLKEAEDFYCGILQFTKTYTYQQRIAFFQLGSLVLEIVADGKDHKEENKKEERHIAIACTNIEEVYAYLKKHNVQIEEPGIVELKDFGKNGCKYVMFRGPQQERLEYQEIL